MWRRIPCVGVNVQRKSPDNCNPFLSRPLFNLYAGVSSSSVESFLCLGACSGSSCRWIRRPRVRTRLSNDGDSITERMTEDLRASGVAAVTIMSGLEVSGLEVSSLDVSGLDMRAFEWAIEGLSAPIMFLAASVLRAASTCRAASGTRLASIDLAPSGVCRAKTRTAAWPSRPASLACNRALDASALKTVGSDASWLDRPESKPSLKFSAWAWRDRGVAAGRGQSCGAR